MKNKIIFTLNETHIIIDLKKPLNMVHCCERMPIFLIHNKKKILLSNDTLQENMYVFYNQLNNVLKNESSLPSSMTWDIGYRFNETLQENQETSYDQSQEYCIENNLLWNDLYAAWLFNDIKGNIIFEVTPIYPGTFIDSTDSDIKNRIESYATWIQSYQPYLTLTIPESIALQWLAQVEIIIKQIEANNASVKDNKEYH